MEKLILFLGETVLNHFAKKKNVNANEKNCNVTSLLFY